MHEITVVSVSFYQKKMHEIYCSFGVVLPKKDAWIFLCSFGVVLPKKKMHAI